MNYALEHTMLLNTKIAKARVLQMCFITVLLSGCSSIEPSDVPNNQHDEEVVSFFTGKAGGTNIMEIGSDDPSSEGMPVNALLWRAALDVASFVPIADVDTFGGSILTEWYVPKDQKNRRLKLAVFVIGRELRSDAIKVRAYVETREDETWESTSRDEKLSRQIEDLILTRAREMRAAMISETKD
jgi:hypothetical protein